MRPTRNDGVILFYNYAAVLSGGYVAMTLDVQNRWELLALTFVLAVGWTVYFRFGMVPRLSDDEE